MCSLLHSVNLNVTCVDVLGIKRETAACSALVCVVGSGESELLYDCLTCDLRILRSAEALSSAFDSSWRSIPDAHTDNVHHCFYSHMQTKH